MKQLVHKVKPVVPFVQKVSKFVKDETIHVGCLFEKPAHMVYFAMVAMDAHSPHGYAEAAVLATIILSFYNTGEA